MSQNEDFTVQLTVTPEQARAVVKAIDVYIRICMGQFGIVSEQFILHGDADTRRADKLLYEARRALIPELSGGMGHSFSISGCPDETAKVAFDVLQVLRQREALGRHPDGGLSVVFDDPMFVSKSTPRPKARNLNALDRLADL